MDALKVEAREFSRVHARTWERIGEDFPRWIFSSVPEVPSPRDLLDVFWTHLPGPRVLSAGGGPVPRDVDYLAGRGCRTTGIDLVPESVRKARGRSAVGNDLACVDLEGELPFRDEAFDGIECIAVIQHMSRRTFLVEVLPHFARVPHEQGVFLLAFKRGVGIQRIEDRKLALERTFQLYDPREVLEAASQTSLFPLPIDEDHRADWLEFADERDIPHAALLLPGRSWQNAGHWLLRSRAKASPWEGGPRWGRVRGP